MNSSQRPAEHMRVGSGVAGAVLCFAVLAGLHAVTVPLFWPVDESSHASYALLVTEGRLPRITTPIPAERLPGLADRVDWDRRRGFGDRDTIWTSTHPPLYFLLAGVPLRIGGVLAARATTVALGAAGVVATAWLASLLVPSRPRVTVAAAAFAALSSPLVHFSGLIFADALAFTVTTVTMAATLTVVGGGLTPARLMAVAAAAAAGALTRATGLAVAAIAAGGVALGVWRHSRVTGWWRGTPAAGVVLATTVAASGWFYLRNLRLYGDLTGASALFERFARSPNAELSELLTSPGFWLGVHDRFVSDLATGVWFQGWTTHTGRAISAVVAIGLAFVVARWLGAGARICLDAALAWLVALAVPATMLVSIAGFHSQGGSPHGRYLLSALGVLAVLAAVGVMALPGARGVPACVVLLALAAHDLALWLRFRAEGAEWYPDRGGTLTLPVADLPWAGAWAVLAVVGFGLGAGLVGRALLVHDARDDPQVVEEVGHGRLPLVVRRPQDR